MLATQASPIRSQPRPMPQAPAAVLRRARWWLIFCALRPCLGRLAFSLLALLLLAFLVQAWPALGHWSLGVINLPGLIAVAAIASLLLHGARLAWSWPNPQPQEVFKQVEQASQLPFQPLSGMNAKLPTGMAGITTKLWQLHWQRLAERLAERSILGQGEWRSGWGQWMRLRGRGLVIQLALVAALTGYYGWPQALRLPALFGAAAPVDFAAWVEAPSYAAKPAMTLASNGTTQLVPDGVAAGSMLQVRANLSSDRSGGLQNRRQGGQVMRLLAVNQYAALTQPAPDSPFQTASLTLDQSGSYELWQGGHRLARWQFTVIPAKTPQIDWRPAPSINPQQRLVLPYQLRDDYGVSALELQVVSAEGIQGGADGAEPIPLPLMGNGRDKAVEGQAVMDLRDHPLAGQPVVITLRATNLAKAMASTPPFQVILPRRVFTDPLAQQVDKAMQRLQQKPSERSAVAEQLAAVQQQLAQKGDSSRIGIYLALQMVVQELESGEAGSKAAGTQQGQRAANAVPMLRQIARGLEEGDAARWQDRFAKARQEMAAAMRDPSRRDEVPELLRQMQQAWQGYLTSTMAQAKTEGGNRPISQGLLGKQSNPVDKLLKDIQQALALGDQARAEQLLQQWQQLASQLKPMPPELAEKMAQADAWAQAMQKLVREQEALRDQTRAVVDRPPQEKIKDKSAAKKAAPETAAPSLPSADAQVGVREQLGQLMAKGAELMKELPPAAGQADQAMSQAITALQRQQAKPALSSQEQAVEALKQGQSEAEQALSDQLQQAMQQAGIGGLLSPGNLSLDPFARNAEEGEGNGSNPEGVVTIPDQAEPRFLRQVLDRLRNRLQNLPADAPDRPYLERLLGF